MNAPTLCETVFDKSFEDLQFDDLKKFLASPRIETDVIEYKAFDERGRKEIGTHEQRINETLCAMMNSEGGIVVWGAPIGTRAPGSKEKIVQGELTHVPLDLESDQLTDRLTSRITPLPPVIRHRQLSKDGTRIYLFEVPKSPFGPHQIGGTYFFRLYGKTEKAPHHIVQALMRQVTFPDVRAYFRVTRITQELETNTIHFKIACWNHSMRQNERDVSLQVIVGGGRFIHNEFDKRKLSYGHGMQQITMTGVTDTLYFGVMHEEYFQVQVPLRKQQDGDEAYFQIAVGGRYAPLRISHYFVHVVAGQSDYGPLTVKTLDNRLMSDTNYSSDFEDNIKEFEGLTSSSNQ